MVKISQFVASYSWLESRPDVLLGSLWRTSGKRGFQYGFVKARVRSSAKPTICGSPKTRSSFFCALYNINWNWRQNGVFWQAPPLDVVQGTWMKPEHSGLQGISLLALPSIRTFLLNCFISFKSCFFSFSSWFMLLNLWPLPMELILCFLVVLYRDQSRRLHGGRKPLLSHILPSTLLYLRRGDIACFIFSMGLEFNLKVRKDGWIVRSQIPQRRVLFSWLEGYPRLQILLRNSGGVISLWSYVVISWHRWVRCLLVYLWESALPCRSQIGSTGPRLRLGMVAQLVYFSAKSSTRGLI